MPTADRASVANSLAAFKLPSLKNACRQFLSDLEYKSDRFPHDSDSLPSTFLEAFSAVGFDKDKALFSEWKTADLVFQLTDEELGRQSTLFTETSIDASEFKSYVFVAIELRENEYARGKFSAIARQINRIFPMPVMVFFRHHSNLTIAVINRRRSKTDEQKDVLGKVTLICDINYTDPHPGHLDILKSLALSNLVHPQKKVINDFDTLHASWEQIFNIELLNKQFYREIANWYFWALPQVEFPTDLEPDSEKRRATGLIRLLTRLIFCWFLKEKGLIPEKLFHKTELESILTELTNESSSYYHAILQNLFFATLNQRMGKDPKGEPYRFFAKDEGFHKNRATYDVNNLFRYESLFQDQEQAISHFEDIPFLNGGLFECLDRTEEETNKKLYLDGFSRNATKRPKVPNVLFFGEAISVNLSDIYGDTKHRAERVSGLIQILNRYKFTIVENTPIDQEIALDPELLGKVFENLLASYNEETKTTARKQTGSFYTPRPIVDYMVDESLKAHFGRVLVEKAAMSEEDAKVGLELLFAYTEKDHLFNPVEVSCLIEAIDAIKILDPACGSGAFPMGALHKLVFILGKLDPDNERWKQTQLAKLDSAPMREELERLFAENDDDYGRKLYLIENCLFGVDIQPIAIQISKLRFFISLICDQRTQLGNAENRGIRPLPNLETKFVAANTLIGLPELEQNQLVDLRIDAIEKQIETLYHSHFSMQQRNQKFAIQQKLKALRNQLGDILADNGMSLAKSKHVAQWDPFDSQSSADFFDPHWMFGVSVAKGFDITIGNPPYIRADEQSESNIEQRLSILASRQYETLWEKWDIFVPFLERSYKLLRTGGVSTMIVSDAFCHSKYAQKAQNWFLQNARILRLDFCGEVKIFDASVHNVITCFQKAEGANSEPLRRLHRGGVGDVSELPTDKQANLTHRVFFPEEAPTAGFNCKSVSLEAVCYISVGMVVHADEKVAKGAFELEDLVSDSSDTQHPFRFVEGKHLARWFSSETKWLEWGTPRAPHMFRRKTFPELYNAAEKIFIHRTGGEGLRSCYDDQQTLCNHTVIIALPWFSLKGTRNKSIKKAARYRGEMPLRLDLPQREELEAISRRFDVKYLLGVMNSDTARDFLRANRRSNTDLYPDDWKRLPIPDVSEAQQKPIVDLVDQILALKRANHTAEISELETKLNVAVAALYELTPEEITCVEGTTK